MRDVLHKEKDAVERLATWFMKKGVANGALG